MTRIGALQPIATYPQVNLSLEEPLRSSYPARDTISSLAAKGIKRLFVVTIFLGALYALYCFFTRKPLSTPSNSSSAAPILTSAVSNWNKEEVNRKVVLNTSSDEIVIIAKDRESRGQEVTSPFYLMAHVLLRLKNPKKFQIMQPLNGLMSALGSSPNFKESVQAGNVDDFRKLIVAVNETYRELIPKIRYLPEEAYKVNSESGEYPIVTRFNKLMNQQW